MTLVGIHLGLLCYDRRRVDGTWLKGERVAGSIDDIVAVGTLRLGVNPRGLLLIEVCR